MINWLKHNKINAIIIAILIAGIALISYPSIANWWNSFHQTRAIMSYADAVANLNAEDYDRIWKNAKEYNKELGESGFNWHQTDAELKEYEKQLDVDGTGVMGYIDIPIIRVQLPLYHGIDETVLQTAIGHLSPTSLPVGGKNSHCSLSGHRGLPSARLFTDLDKLREGDTWTINVMDRTLTYEVDQVRIVEPEDLSELQLEKKKDYCTLITCTPYGINTHRLLVRGHRIPNSLGDANMIADALQIQPVYVAPVVAAPILLILLILLLYTTRKSANEGRHTYEAIMRELKANA